MSPPASQTLPQSPQHPLHLRPGHLLRLGDENLFLAGGSGIFLIPKQLLVELFTRAQACVYDFHGRAVRISVKLYHSLGQLADLYRFAHIQHKQFPALGDGRGLQHQAGRLRDGHEVPDDVRMG